jgi:RimJ/RimL family protein N-acetyltransferase
MKQGQVVERFDVKSKNGEKLRVVFRYPSKKDVRAALRMVNSARDEADFLGMRKHETMKTEKIFIEKQIENMKKRKGVALFVEVNEELAGDSVINPLQLDSEKHVGHLGIMLRERFTGFGIGTRLARKMLELAKKNTLFKVIESGFTAKNERSKRLHKKLGFRQYGVFPKAEKLKDETYCGRVCVYKVIKKL